MIPSAEQFLAGLTFYRAPKLITLESSSGPCRAPPKKRSRKDAKTQRSKQPRDPKDLCAFASLRDLFLCSGDLSGWGRPYSIRFRGGRRARGRLMKLEGKALVTGASGFIGGRLRDALLAAGADVVAIRRKGSPAAKKGRSAEVEYDDVDGLSRLVSEEGPDWVFHVAGATKGVTYADFQRANVLPTKNLLEALGRSHP